MRPYEEESVTNPADAGRSREAAQHAFAARLPGVPVADLVFDSLLDVRDGQAPLPPRARQLRFEAGRDVVHVTVTPHRDGVTVELTMEPPRAARVRLRSRDRESDFLVLPAAPLRLDVASSVYSFAVEDSEGRGLLQTAWVRL